MAICRGSRVRTGYLPRCVASTTCAVQVLFRAQRGPLYERRQRFQKLPPGRHTCEAPTTIRSLAAARLRYQRLARDP